MGNIIIQDGTGNGYRAEVSNANRLLTAAVISTEFHHASEIDGRAYTMAANELNLSNSAVDYNVLLFQNTDPTLDFHLNKIYVSWNGGSTNHNRVLTARLRLGGVVPTANSTLISPVNINTTKSLIALSNVYSWNGTGNGMTILTPGTNLYSSYFKQGYTIVDFESAFILTYNIVVSISFQPEEAGLASVVISGHYLEPKNH
jgi:hypothetical protein